VTSTLDVPVVFGRNTGRDSHFDATLVAPTSVQTAPNTPISIKYDASGICWGQSVRRVNGRHGTVIWAPGTIQDLRDTYGIVTIPGYSQPTTQQVQIESRLIAMTMGVLIAPTVAVLLRPFQ
jgi:hypothetical protein